jgi:hypothetical protein
LQEKRPSVDENGSLAAKKLIVKVVIRTNMLRGCQTSRKSRLVPDCAGAGPYSMLQHPRKFWRILGDGDGESSLAVSSSNVTESGCRTVITARLSAQPHTVLRRR